jgi:hypothetical protein
MNVRRTLLAGGAAMVASLGFAGTATAAFPDFSDCPRASVNTCINIVSTDGSYQTIKGFRVPLHAGTLEIRGGIRYDANGQGTFIPPAGTNGFFARSVPVPGGLLGIDLPIGLNMVNALPELAGPASAIRIDQNTLTLALPIKLRLTNPLLGSNCHIGSNSNPVRLVQITGTTSPPPPNRPISGRFGTFSVGPPAPATVYFRGNTNVDNSFSVPGASGCGFFGLGLIDLLVNAKLGLPSAAGNNTIVINNDVALTEGGIH